MAKFEECFDKAFEAEKERFFQKGLGRFAVEPKTAKVLAFFWNILASGDGKFDDTVYLDNNNNIVSIPKKAKKTEEEKPEADVKTKKRGKEKSDLKTAKVKNEVVEDGDQTS